MLNSGWLTKIGYAGFFFNDTATTEIYTLSLHDALPIYPFAPPAGQRATVAADRVCGPTGATVLQRNTLRKDNQYVSWDVRFSRPFTVSARGELEAIVEVFNLLGTDNFRDPSYGNLLFNFDGTIRSGLGDPRQLQAGVRWLF